MLAESEVKAKRDSFLYDIRREKNFATLNRKRAVHLHNPTNTKKNAELEGIHGRELSIKLAELKSSIDFSIKNNNKEDLYEYITQVRFLISRNDLSVPAKEFFEAN